MGKWFHRRISSAFLAGLFIAVFAVGDGPVSAQQIDPAMLPPELLEKYKASQDQSSSNELQPVEEVREYDGPEATAEPSRVERIYTRRSGRPLEQIGYEVFGSGGDVVLRQSGAIQDNYILGAGDEIVVDLRGQENRTIRVKVDRNGRVVLPELNPISASGRRFGDFRAELEEVVGASYIATQAFISIGKIRQISVLVSGEVNNPGVFTLNGLSTVLDALMLAGGVEKTGSLRNIKILRGREVIKADLYGLLGFGEIGTDVSLIEGDKIVVPSLGRTLAISGWVRNPGIYELKDTDKGVSVEDLIGLAGDEEVRGAYRYSIMRLGRDGSVKLQSLRGRAGKVLDGEVLFVDPVESLPKGFVKLIGHVSQPGDYPVEKVKSLKGLLGGVDDFGRRPYMFFALVSRFDASSMTRQLIPFSPKSVLQGSFDLPLNDQDYIRIFTREEALLLAQSVFEANVVTLANKADEDENRRKEQTDYLAREADEIAVLDTLTMSGDLELRPDSLSRAQREGDNVRQIDADPIVIDALGDPETYISVEEPMVRQVAAESRVEVIGAVRVPGIYLFLPGTSLFDALAAAGGPESLADFTSVEVTSLIADPRTGQSHTERRYVRLGAKSLKEASIKPFDTIRVRKVFTDRTIGTVRITGEVRYPGEFDLIRGERLSSLLARAGGLTDTAYPYGSVFTRVSAAEREKAGYERAADQIQGAVTNLVAPGDAKLGASEFQALMAFSENLRNAPAIGRVAIQVDPARLSSDPMLDVIMEPGDRIHVPTRPATVTVIGEVLNPGSFQFVSGKEALSYVRMAGGYTVDADKSRVFVVMPDGSAKRIKSGAFNFSKKMLAPGATIVVPKDLKPFRLDEFMIDATQVISQLAVTAASISVVGR